MSRTEPTDLVERGRRVLALEAAAIRGVAERLGPPFAAAVRLLAAARGRVIVSGVGKSGLIARKIAATLTSTGTPASFLHPVDSLHGDLGIVGPDDVAILLSKSGGSDELFGLVMQLKRLDVPIITIVGDADSLLARQAQVVLDASVRRAPRRSRPPRAPQPRWRWATRSASRCSRSRASGARTSPRSTQMACCPASCSCGSPT